MKLLNIFSIFNFFYLKEKSLDLLYWNSNNTLDKTLNAFFTLYNSLKNETIYINYGDGSSQILRITSC